MRVFCNRFKQSVRCSALKIDFLEAISTKTTPVNTCLFIISVFLYTVIRKFLFSEHFTAISEDKVKVKMYILDEFPKAKF